MMKLYVIAYIQLCHLQQIRFLDDLRKRSAANCPGIKQWASLMMHMLNNAVQDIRIAYNCYAHITRSTPMIYLLLANKTKDGFDMANLFFKFDGHFRTTAEMKELLPFYQMGSNIVRLC